MKSDINQPGRKTSLRLSEGLGVSGTNPSAIDSSSEAKATLELHHRLVHATTDAEIRKVKHLLSRRRTTAARRPERSGCRPLARAMSVFRKIGAWLRSRCAYAVSPRRTGGSTGLGNPAPASNPAAAVSPATAPGQSTTGQSLPISSPQSNAPSSTHQQKGKA
jgi:hypothetical protein